MPFQRKYSSLILNGTHYTQESLLNKDSIESIASVVQSVDNSWKTNLHNFIVEWLDDKDTVTVQTSGSTGTPKTIQLSKQHMMNSAFMTGNYFGFKSGQKALLCLPCNFIAGKMMVVRAMLWGLDLYVVPPSSHTMQSINFSIDFAAMIPLQVTQLMQQQPSKFSLLKKLIIGGGKLDISVQEQLQTISTECYATYGMTETITHVAVKKLNGQDAPNNFKALSNVSFSVDSRNCLRIDAPKLSEMSVQTNDIVDLKGEHQFEWLGRFDNVINTGGVKVFPEKIEGKLEKLIANRFFITSLPDPKLGEKVVLLIESEEWNKPTIDTLILRLKQILSKFEIPKAVFFVEKFEETPTKKIQRNRTKNSLEKFNL